MKDKCIVKQKHIFIKDNSFIFSPWTNEYERYNILKINEYNHSTPIPYNFNSYTKKLNLLYDCVNKSIIIHYYINLREERKLKLLKIKNL